MRELKFRAWGKNIKEYLSQDGVEPFIYTIKDISDGCIYDIDKFIIEPSTGLKDKNGEEIYENDIVKMPEWQVEPRYEVVKYNKAGFDPFQEGCFECMSPDGDDVEVIGNIHENKELLEGGEE